MEASSAAKVNGLVRRSKDLAETIADAVSIEARKTSAQRAKQLRQEPSDVRASTLIALAQKRPELRSLLFDLMTAECGDGDAPAVVLDRIARMFR